MAKQKKLIKDTLILFAITLIAGIALGLVYEATEHMIAVRNQQAKMDAYKKVFADASTFEADDTLAQKAEQAKDNLLAKNNFKNITINEALLATDGSGNKLGYVLSVTTGEGYNGNITISMGYSLDGVLKDIKILEISETAGLGAKAKEIGFTGQFTDKQVEQFEVAKSGSTAEHEIDSISGATITSKAVVDAINAGMYFINESAEVE